MDNMLTLLISAAIGVVTGAVATAYKSRKDLEAQYDIKLREERIEAYKVLWKALEPLAYYAPGKPLGQPAPDARASRRTRRGPDPLA